MTDNAPPTSQFDPSSDRVKILFDRLHDLSPAERKTILDAELAGDAETRAAVESLLAAAGAASNFMAAPTVDNSPSDLDASSRANREMVSKQIGPYKLLQPIGEGGFGTVYLAEQHAPVRRRVALKVIKPGMDSRQVIARFEAERQALAMMDHPNIARVFDAGTTESGRPYFAMELVNGVPITEYCDQNTLSARQRLELFIPVCQAVQHAHQKGVIHRDIKPSNVLVTLHDGVPIPKVIDFGIAKAIHSPLTDKTLFTELRTMIGTLEYMAPEQAEISGLDVDTRSDVYSLGVLLYELLTGTTPFDPKELRSKVYAEIQRVLREVDPPKPSTRLSTMDQLPSVAAKRASDPKRLGAMMRGELDWVVMKCLEKDRTRRYDSPAALSADVGRYLTGDVVVAHPPGAGYRFAKFVRKHRAALSVTTIVFVALAVGLVVAVIGLRRARAAELLANLRLEQTTREVAKSTAINEFLNGMLREANPFQTGNGDTTVRQMLEISAKKIDAGELSGDAEVNAIVRRTIAQSFRGLGRTKEAVTQSRAALATFQSLHAGDDPNTASALDLLANSLADDNVLDEAETTERAALAMRERLFGPSSLEVSESLNDLATILFNRSAYADAETVLRRCVAIDRTLIAAGDHASPDLKSPPSRLFATHLESLAIDLNQREKVDEALPLYREALAAIEKYQPDNQAERLHILSNLSSMLLARGQRDEALTLQSEATALARKIFPPASADLALALMANGDALVSQNKLTEGLALYDESLIALRAARGANHPDVADMLSKMASITSIAGDFPKAEAEARESYEIALAAFGPTNRRTTRAQTRLGLNQINSGNFSAAEKTFRDLLALLKSAPKLEDPAEISRVEMHLGTVLGDIDPKSVEADHLLRQAIDGLRAAKVVDGNLEKALLNAAASDREFARWDECEAHLRDALEVNAKISTAPDSTRALIEVLLASSYAKNGTHLDDAEKLARDALAQRRQMETTQPWQLENCNSIIGEVLMKRGNLVDAEPLIRQAFNVIDVSNAPARNKIDPRRRLIELLDRQGKVDESAKLRAATQPTTATTSP